MRKITVLLAVLLLSILILVVAGFYAVKAQDSVLVAPTLTPPQGTVDNGDYIWLTSSALTTVTAPYTYQWFTEAPDASSYSLISGATSSRYEFVAQTSTATGTWSFILQVTDSTGAAVNSTAATVTVYPALEAGFSVKTPIYVNEPVQIIAHVAGGEPPYVYQWETQIILQPYFVPPYFLTPSLNWTKLPSDNSSTFNFVASTPGTYIMQFDVNDTSSARANSTGIGTDETCDVLPLPTLSPSPTPIPAPPPSITLLSPQNQNYTTNNVPLNFILSEPIQWVGYSLDGQANITIDANTTISQLTTGTHNITVYANDTFGHIGASETVNFTISKPASFPIAEAAAATITVIAISAVGAGYIMKRKHST